MSLEKINNMKGVTLIALTITIVVLAIIAGITITAVTGEKSTIQEAKDAKASSEEESAKEQVQAAVLGCIKKNGEIDKNKLSKKLNTDIKEFPAYVDINGIKVKIDANGDVTIKGKDDGESTTKKISEVTSTYAGKNTQVEDEYGNTFMLPEGFKVRKDETTNNADTVDKGIVIEDQDGNQFVWIPVGTFKKDKNGTTEEVKLGRYDFASGGTASDYKGSFTETNKGYVNAIAKNIDDFKSKVDSNHGYYIGRYEAGVENGILDTSAMTNGYTAPNKNWTGYVATEGKNLKLVCKSGQQPWNYVTQNKASELARAMYTGKTYESDLINSYAWDTAIVFIQKCSGDMDYSRQPRLQSTLAKTGEATDGANKDVRCNIYDMAGNEYEWSTETYYGGSNYPCVLRGGDYNNSNNYASTRDSGLKTTAFSRFSFRPLLYL